MQYKGQRAVITGASSGIGEGFARHLHSRGAKVLLIARRESRLNQICEELNRQRADSAEFLAADLSKFDRDREIPGCLQVAAQLSQSQVDILVNNAGFGSFGRFEELDASRELEMIDLNIKAGMLLAHAVVPQMKERRSGALLVVSSIAAFQPIPYMATYAATKSYNLHHTLALRAELAKFGIGVLAICPGPTSTEFSTAAYVPSGVLDIKSDSVNEVVRQSLNALERGSLYVVTGRRSKVLALLSSVTPRRMSTYVTERVLKKHVR